MPTKIAWRVEVDRGRLLPQVTRRSLPRVPLCLPSTAPLLQAFRLLPELMLPSNQRDTGVVNLKAEIRVYRKL
jgi:hypothetical protein